MPSTRKRRRVSNIVSYTAQLEDSNDDESPERTPENPQRSTASKKRKKMPPKKKTTTKTASKILDCPKNDEDFAPWIMSEMKKSSFLDFPRYKKLKSPKKKRKSRKPKNDSDDDIVEVGNDQLSLICPLSTKTIKYPCRYNSCTHLGCFDGVAMMSTLAIKLKGKDYHGQVKCPICKSLIIRNLFKEPGWKESRSLIPVISKMVFDTEVNEILQATIRIKDVNGDPIKHVDIENDGSWKCAEKQKIESVSIDPTGKLEISELKELTSKYMVSSDDSDLGLTSSSSDSDSDSENKENRLVRRIDKKLKMEKNSAWEKYKKDNKIK